MDSPLQPGGKSLLWHPCSSWSAFLVNMPMMNLRASGCSCSTAMQCQLSKWTSTPACVKFAPPSGLWRAATYSRDASAQTAVSESAVWHSLSCPSLTCSPGGSLWPGVSPSAGRVMPCDVRAPHIAARRVA